jgi:hypothetical protein
VNASEIYKTDDEDDDVRDIYEANRKMTKIEKVQAMYGKK